MKYLSYFSFSYIYVQNAMKSVIFGNGMEWLRIWVAKFEFSWETYKSPTLLYTCPGPPLVYGYFPCSAGLMPHPPMYGKAERSIWIVYISPARGVSSTQCPVPASSVHHWTVSCRERVCKQGITKPFDSTALVQCLQKFVYIQIRTECSVYYYIRVKIIYWSVNNPTSLVNVV